MFLPVCVLWIEIASKSSCLHLASLLSDQLTSKVLRLNICISEVCCGDFCGDHCQVFIVFYSLCSSVVCPPVFYFVQERAAAGTIRAVHFQQAGRRAQHVNHPQHQTGRRGYLHLQGHQQGGISGERALPQSVW